MGIRTNHERRADLYAKAKLRPIPVSMEVRRQSKAAGLTSKEDISTMRKQIKSIKKYDPDSRIMSPKAFEAYTGSKPGTGGYTMMSERKTAYPDGSYGITKPHTSGGSSSSTGMGNRRPSAVAKTLMNGGKKSDRSTYYEDK
jgi:hypothetical protein